jgi:hypothetical protein
VKIPGTHFFRGGVDPGAIMRLEGLGLMKNVMTPSGIEHVTFRQRMKQILRSVSFLRKSRGDGCSSVKGNEQGQCV